MVLLLPFLAACSKSDTTNEPVTPPEPLIDTVGRIWLTPVNEAQGYDTTNNYISTYHFSKGAAYATLAYYIASNSSGTHRVRYVGTEPLFHPDSVISRGGILIDFKMNRNLQGKAVFEIYNNGTGTIYKKYVAANTDVVIRASFSVVDNYAVTNKKIGEAILYYIVSKLSDATLFRKG